jgi:hypothetical protein
LTCFVILYSDQQMHNYFANYHTATCFDTRVFLRHLLINTLPSCTSISKAPVGNTVKIIEVQQTKICNNYKNTGPKLRKTNAAIWFNKTCKSKQLTLKVKHLNCKLYYQQLHLKYLCNLARYWLQAPWGWRDSVETCSSLIICEIIVHLLVVVQNNKKKCQLC